MKFSRGMRQKNIVIRHPPSEGHITPASAAPVLLPRGIVSINRSMIFWGQGGRIYAGDGARRKFFGTPMHSLRPPVGGSNGSQGVPQGSRGFQLSDISLITSVLFSFYSHRTIVSNKV